MRHTTFYGIWTVRRSTKYEDIRGLVSVLVLVQFQGPMSITVESPPSQGLLLKNKMPMLIIHMLLSYHDFIITSVRKKHKPAIEIQIQHNSVKSKCSLRPPGDPHQ